MQAGSPVQRGHLRRIAKSESILSFATSICMIKARLNGMNDMKKHHWVFVSVLLILLIGVSWSVASPDNATVRDLTPEQFKAMLDRRGDDPGVMLLDIRTPKEFQQGHIEGAFLLDFYAGDFIERLKALDKNKTYMIYCRSGNRSGKTLAMLEQLGFRPAYHLNSGLVGWARANYPLAR